ncbi:MAG: 4Fe-4S binding protein [Anaerolineaceae bacterium]|nr:4Fe-4S binding protein [Anaerolineaceae bacterium]
MATPLWFISFIKYLFPQKANIAKLSRIPVIRELVDYILFHNDGVVYLTRDAVIPIREEINSVQNTVLPSQVVSHFIEKANHHWIMNNCLCRDASQCDSYPHDLGCLFLGETVTKINPELGRIVSKAEALAHAEKCREAGLIHMIGRNKLDSVWMGVGPGHKLMTICNCCSCCCLYSVLPQLDDSISKKITRMPGVYIQVTEACVGCGTCTKNVCFVDAIKLVDGKAIISEDCRGCGNCIEICPHGAIEITIHEEAYVDKVIEKISPLVDFS